MKLTEINSRSVCVYERNNFIMIFVIKIKIMQRNLATLIFCQISLNYFHLLLGRNQYTDNPANAHDLNVINDFVSNLGPAKAADLPPSQKNYTDFITPIINTFVLSTVSRNELLNAISGLQNKCSSGFDGFCRWYHRKDCR